ncbi:MAG: hypothetical protein ACFCVG_06905 [Kineosporiaceae bacterium]
MTEPGSRRHLAAVVVAAAMLGTACTGDAGEDATGSPTPAASPSQGATATCLDVTVEGVALGLTVPAGFTPDLSPESRAAAPGDADPVAVAEFRSAGRDLPGGLLLAYGFGPGEGTDGPRAVEDAVIDLVDRTGGTSSDRATTSPTTIAGLPAETGARPDDRALDYTAPSDPPSQLSWWSVVIDDVRFVVTLATATEQAESAAAGIADGLRPGGCGSRPPGAAESPTPTAT